MEKITSITTVKTIKKTIFMVFILILILVILFKLIKVQDIILKMLYPQKYSEYIIKYSEEYGIDKNFIYAIIKTESNFKTDIKSNSNAIGLMQLMENTAKEMANSIGFDYYEGCLYDPKINVQIGIKYYSDLLQEYNNNYMLALTAYNAGIGNVKRWIEEGILKEDGSNIEDIPYKETSNYVRKIIRDYNIYKDLYN